MAVPWSIDGIKPWEIVYPCYEYFFWVYFCYLSKNLIICGMAFRLLQITPISLLKNGVPSCALCWQIFPSKQSILGFEVICMSYQAHAQFLALVICELNSMPKGLCCVLSLGLTTQPHALAMNQVIQTMRTRQHLQTMRDNENGPVMANTGRYRCGWSSSSMRPTGRPGRCDVALFVRLYSA